MKKSVFVFCFFCMSLYLAHGQDSLFLFSNLKYCNYCGANEDGKMVPSIYEIKLPNQPSHVFYTCREQVIIMPDGSLLFIAQETAPRQKFLLSDIAEVVKAFDVEDFNLLEQFEELDDGKIIHIYKMGDFVILVICHSNLESNSLLNSLSTFKITQSKMVIPW